MNTNRRLISSFENEPDWEINEVACWNVGEEKVSERPDRRGCARRSDPDPLETATRQTFAGMERFPACVGVWIWLPGW